MIMLRRFLISMLCMLVTLVAFAAPRGFQVRGKVMEAGTHNPVPGAAVKIGDDYLWAVTDLDGSFVFENVQQGEWVVEASCL